MSFILKFFKDILSGLGLWKKDAKIVFLGLDNAGKTTLMRRLKDGKFVQIDPTQHAHSDELVMGKVRFKAFDLGGHAAARKIWKNYFPNLDGIIYMVDAADPKRFEESKKELQMILSATQVANVPILILGNKIDKPGAVPEEEFKIALGLETQTSFGTQKITEMSKRPIQVYMCSVESKIGYADGFKWLSETLP